MEFEKCLPHRPDILIIELAKLSIQSLGDVLQLQDEAVTIHEDYPDYHLIIFKP